MNKKEAIKKAIDALKGKPLEKGAIIAHDSDKMSYKFTGYEGDNACCYYENIKKKFPKNEVFDVNKVREAAQSFLTLGFYDPKHRITMVSFG